MTTVTLIQAASFACQAGFKGQDGSLYTILAIARFESGLNTTAVNANDAHGGSFGILQINASHFGEAWPTDLPYHDPRVHLMSKEAALDPGESFKFAYWLSKQGKDFSPWSTDKMATDAVKKALAQELMLTGVQFLCQIQPN